MFAGLWHLGRTIFFASLLLSSCASAKTAQAWEGRPLSEGLQLHDPLVALGKTNCFGCGLLLVLLIVPHIIVFRLVVCMP